MKRRILSIVLAMAMIMSLVPAFSIAGAQDSGELAVLTYDISNTALGAANTDAKNTFAALDQYKGNEAKLSGDTWKATYVNMNQRRLYPALFSGNVKYANMGAKNGVIFAVYVPVAGEYVPTVTFDKSATGGNVATRIITETQRAENEWILTSSAGVNTVLAAWDADASGIVDLYDAAATGFSKDVQLVKTFEKFTFEQGYNYFLFNIESCNSAVTSDKAPMMEISAITLTPVTAGGEMGDGTDTYEYKTTFTALSGNKLPKTKTADLYNNNTYTRQTSSDILIQNSALMNRSAKSVLNASAETVDEWNIMDFDITDPWDFVCAQRTAGPQIQKSSGSLYVNLAVANYDRTSNPHYVAFRVNVKNGGKYNLSIDSKNVENGPVPAVYFVKDNGAADNSGIYALVDASEPVGYHSFADTGASGYSVIGEVETEDNGEYLVIFYPDQTSLQKNSVTTNGAGVYQQFYLNGIRLSPIPKGVEGIILDVNGTEVESATLAEYMTAQLGYKLFDKSGTELEDITEENLSVAFESSDEEIATVSGTGLITAMAPGDVKITVSVTYNGIGPKKAELLLKVTESVAGEYKYVFHAGAYGENADFTGSANVGAFTMDKIDPETSAKWQFEGYDGINYLRLSKPDTGYILFNARNKTDDYATFTKNRPSLALTISVPEDGVYLPKFEYQTVQNGFKYNVYLSKRLESDTDISGTALRARVGAMTAVETLGEIDSYGEKTSFQLAPIKSFEPISLAKGEYLLVIALSGRNAGWIPTYAAHASSPWLDQAALASFTLKGAQLFDYIRIIGDSAIDAGETASLSVKGYLAGGKEIDISEAPVNYESLTPDVVLVDSETGEITGLRDGNGKVKAMLTYEGLKVEDEFDVVVTDESPVAEASVLGDSGIKYLGESSFTVEGKTVGGFALNPKKAEVVWHISDISPAGGIEDRGNGVFYGSIFGATAKLYATVSVNGESVDTEVVEVAVGTNSGKTGRTYYTEERIAAAQENVKKYDWAKALRDEAVRAADKYIGLDNELWNLIPGEGIPRGYGVGYRDDPEKYLCRYCNEDIDLISGGVYTIDAINDPWKIQCPKCKRRFPSNDFAKLYELGKNDKGVYDVELAHKRNAELVANGEKGYLTNELYPEIAESNKDPRSKVLEEYGIDPTVDGTTWGVDDGFGYITGRKAYNKDTDTYPCDEVHTYIANYNYYTWYGGEIQNAVVALRDAYLYTGDEKYGKLGAIMIDRIADVYPDFLLDPHAKNGFANGDGGSHVGKIIGRIHETYLQEDFIKAYDAFFPLYDDPQVINFLSNKAAIWSGIENKKESGAVIRMNIEDNLLVESFETIKACHSYGNFGMHQSTCALAAAVLNTSPYTEEMFKWLETYSESDNKTYNTGGDVLHRLVNDVSRDGQGNESAPGYNRIWLTQLSGLAETLSIYGYDGEINLYGNPKYIGMIKSYAPFWLVRRGVPSIGDSGMTGTYSPQPDEHSILVNGYKHTGDIEMAQHLYQIKGGDLSDVHYDVFTKDPESIQKEIKDIIGIYGEYNYDRSSMLTGYGFGVLRSGSLYNSVGSGVVRDTQRDVAIYFGGAKSHLHKDALNLFVEAYGIGMTNDLGYPTATGSSPVRYQWESTSISHNTVVVNEKEQLVSAEPAVPTHFDEKETKVKVMSVDASDYYEETDEYGRTLVMIDYDSEISYTIDFFKILGGYDHLYSFHTSSVQDPLHSENLTFVAQDGGTYASPEQSLGQDPTGKYAGGTFNNLTYPMGYTWMDDVKRCEEPGVSDFWVEYNIKDYRKISRNDNMDIKLRLTMVNDFDINEVSFTNGYPPNTIKNYNYMSHVEYLLVRRRAESESENLNTLFATVIEPYNKTRYIKNIGIVPVTVAETSAAQPGETDVARAIRVELENGRVDYVVYAQNNDVTYNVGDKFEFRGFVGVWSENGDGANIYKYVNDGDMIGNDISKLSELDAAIGGVIVDFQKELEFDNWIDVEFDREISEQEATELCGRMLVAERDGKGNASYIIRGVRLDGSKKARISLGNITAIDNYIDKTDISLGYEYDIAEGRVFEIPMSYEENPAPVFVETEDFSTSVGSAVNIKLNATSEYGNVIYSARQIPRGASVDEETGVLTWKPSSSQIGENLIAIDATDNKGRVSTQYFTITVYGSTTGGGSQTPSAPSAPSTPGASGSAGGGGGAAPAPSTPSDDKTDDKTDETPSVGDADSSLGEG
ncbi:MAG: Ig-like domain-containing protein, partial [Oscillospiraceae bacterium]|nr:Ig-like domain-containing protein [Oscillospiraceae bacterium]